MSEDPLVLIESEDKATALDLRELWAYRELLYFLTWRDIKIRYKQTLLGAAWAIIQPLFAMLLFTLLFGRLARMPSDTFLPCLHTQYLAREFFANAEP